MGNEPRRRAILAARARYHLRSVLPGPVRSQQRLPPAHGWQLPWCPAEQSVDTLLVGRSVGPFHLVCYLRDGDRVIEAYWTTRRGAEALDYSYALMDLTVYGRQERWEGSPTGWPQQCTYFRSDAGDRPGECPEWTLRRGVGTSPWQPAGKSGCHP